MTGSLIAGAAAFGGTLLGCLFAYRRGRRDERRLWTGFVRERYRNGHGADAFRVAVMAKSHAVLKGGWR